MQSDLIKSSAPESWAYDTQSAAGATGGSSSEGGVAVDTSGTAITTFGGFTDIGSGFSSGGVLFRSSGLLRLGQGDNSVILDALDATYRLVIGSEDYATAPFRVTKAGVLNATGATISGTITATAGSIGGWTINSTYLSSGNVKLDAGNESILLGSATAPLTGKGIFIGKDGSDYEFRVGSPADSVYMHYDGTDLNIEGGSINASTITALAAGSEVAIQQWTYTGSFSATDADTVAWSGGTLTFMDGTDFTITGSNTGDMAAFTYIYLDIGVSTTSLQTATSFTAGAGKTLIAVAQPGTSEASFLMMGGSGEYNIDGSNIAAASIIANKISVANLAAISSDLGVITAGSITLDTSGFIRGGQTDFATGTGFFLGYSSDAYKFSLGDATQYLQWDGSSLKIQGADVSIDTGTGVVQGNLQNIITLTAGEAIDGSTTPKPIYIATMQEVTNMIEATSSSGTGTTFHSTNWVAQTFNSGSTYNFIHGASFIITSGAGTLTNMICELYAVDGSDKPTGSALATSTVAETNVYDADTTATDEVCVNFTFDTPYEMTASTNYALVIRKSSGTVNNSIRSGASYASGQAWRSTDSGSTWGSTVTGDLWFIVRAYSSKTLGRAYLCDGNDEYKLGFIGFTTSNVSSGQELLVQVSGTLASFSGLTAGESYYIDDSGNLSITPGTYRCYVGVAISSSEIMIDKDLSEIYIPIFSRHKSATPGTLSWQMINTSGSTNWYYLSFLSTAKSLKTTGVQYRWRGDDVEGNFGITEVGGSKVIERGFFSPCRVNINNGGNYIRFTGDLSNGSYDKYLDGYYIAPYK